MTPLNSGEGAASKFTASCSSYQGLGCHRRPVICLSALGLHVVRLELVYTARQVLFLVRGVRLIDATPRATDLQPVSHSVVLKRFGNPLWLTKDPFIRLWGVICCCQAANRQPPLKVSNQVPLRVSLGSRAASLLQFMSRPHARMLEIGLKGALSASDMVLDLWCDI